jgi:hypothetical protein
MIAKLLSDKQLVNEATTEVAAALQIGWIISQITLEVLDSYEDSSRGWAMI